MDHDPGGGARAASASPPPPNGAADLMAAVIPGRRRRVSAFALPDDRSDESGIPEMRREIPGSRGRAPRNDEALLPPLPRQRRQCAAFAVARVLVIDPVMGIDPLQR